MVGDSKAPVLRPSTSNTASTRKLLERLQSEGGLFWGSDGLRLLFLVGFENGIFRQLITYCTHS